METKMAETGTETVIMGIIITITVETVTEGVMEAGMADVTAVIIITVEIVTAEGVMGAATTARVVLETKEAGHKAMIPEGVLRRWTA